MLNVFPCYGTVAVAQLLVAWVWLLPQFMLGIRPVPKPSDANMKALQKVPLTTDVAHNASLCVCVYIYIYTYTYTCTCTCTCTCTYNSECEREKMCPEDEDQKVACMQKMHSKHRVRQLSPGACEYLSPSGVEVEQRAEV